MNCRIGVQCLSRLASIETMVLIGTNVVSELTRSMPALAVLDRLGCWDAFGLHLSAVGEVDLRHGALILPTCQFRDGLIAEINASA